MIRRRDFLSSPWLPIWCDLLLISAPKTLSAFTETCLPWFSCPECFHLTMLFWATPVASIGHLKCPSEKPSSQDSCIFWNILLSFTGLQILYVHNTKLAIQLLLRLSCIHRQQSCTAFIFIFLVQNREPVRFVKSLMNEVSRRQNFIGANT